MDRNRLLNVVLNQAQEEQPHMDWSLLEEYQPELRLITKLTRHATLEEVKGIIQKHITYYKAEYTKHDDIAIELVELLKAIEGLEKE